jgi:hypothetical protein
VYFHGKIDIQQEKECCYRQIGLELKEETGEMLHLEHSFVWC